MAIVECSFDGQTYSAHIHAEGCSDIKREKRNGKEIYPFAGTVQEWKESEFGDIASDEINAETDRKAWLKEIEFQASEVKVFPCVTDNRCAVFALCTNVATTTIDHPILKSVPSCQRCKDKTDALSR